MALSQDTQNDLYRFFVIAFDAAPGVTYMSQLAEAYESGMSIAQIVEVFTTKPAFTAEYPIFLTHEEFASRLVENVAGTTASSAAQIEARADIVAALNGGMSRGQVIYNVFNNLESLIGDAKWGATAQLMANQIAVAEYYTEVEGGDTTDAATLRAVISAVTASGDYSTAAAKEAVIAEGLLPLTQTFALDGPASVDEGGTALFTLETTNVAAGTAFAYTLGGVSAGDVVGGQLSGTAVVDSQGKAVIEVDLVADEQTEGAEILTLSVAAQVGTTTVNDTSLTPVPTYELTGNAGSVNEGNAVVFTLATTHVAAGSQFAYSLSGVQADDVAGGALTGVATVGANGLATITVNLRADGRTEGAETLTLSVAGQTADVTVNDTSTTQIVLTEGLDVPPATNGTPLADQYYASAATLNPGDILSGGNGLDSFNYAAGSAFPVIENGFATSGIEQFNLTADRSVWMDMSGTSGVQLVRDQNSREDLTLSNGNEIHDVEMVNTTVAHDLTVAYQAATVAGAADVQNLVVNNVLAGSTIDIDGVETFNLATADVQSDLQTVGGDAMANLNVSGETGLRLREIDLAGPNGSLTSSNGGNLRIDDLAFGGNGVIISGNSGDLSVNSLAFAGAGAVDANNGGNLSLDSVSFGAGSSSVNAADLGGAMTMTLVNAAAGGRHVSVTGSEQADSVDAQAGFNVGDGFDGLGGSDILIAGANTLNTGMNAIRNVETLTLASGTLGLLELNQLDTALQTVNVNTDTAGVVQFQNIENDGSERLVVNDAAAQLDGKTVMFDGLITGNGLTTVNLQVDNVNSGTLVSLQDYNDVSLVSSLDPVATLNLQANGSGMFTANLTGMNSLTTLGLSGSADITVNSTASTVRTVNGSATTGDVTINDTVLSDAGSSVVLGSGFDVVFGANGVDNINLGAGGGVAYGFDGNDVLSASGGSSGDAVTFIGGNGADNLSGSDAGDDLHGDGGQDVINGNAGADRITGGLGADNLSGGAGADLFAYQAITESQGAAFADTVTDFVSGTDQFDIREALLATGLNVEDLNMTRFNGNANGFAAAQASLTGLGGVEIVYDTAQRAVYVDVNADGMIDGVNDMIIHTPNTASMQASDFGIVTGNVFTAAVGPFQTSDAADSFENTTTSGGNDIVVAEAGELAGSTILSGGGIGVDVLNVTTTVFAPIDLGTVMDNGFERLNLFGGTMAPVTGPDQTVSLDVFIGNAGGNFTTGTNDPDPDVEVQRVYSSAGFDTVTLTNGNDEARTAGGNDTVNLFNGFAGYVDLGSGDDQLDVAAGASLGAAMLIGGGQLNDFIDAHNGSDLSAASISGFDRIDLDFNGSTTLSVGQYNGLAGATVFGKFVATGTNTVNLEGAGTILLDSTVENWTGDAADQVFVLGASGQSVSAGGGFDTIRNDSFANLTGNFNGGAQSDTFESNVTTNIAGTAGWTSIENIVLNNGSDLTLTGSQHMATVGLTGNDAIANSTTVNVTTGMTDALFGTVETYNLSNQSDNVTVVQGNQTVNLGDAAANTANVAGVTGVTVNGGNAVDTFNLSGNLGASAFNGNGGNDLFNLNGASNGSYDGGADDDGFSLSGIVTGALNVGAGATDTLTLNGGVDITGLTISNFVAATDDVVFGNGSFTMTSGQYGLLVDENAAGGRSGLDLGDTIVITDASTIAFSDANSNNAVTYFGTGAFGTLVMDSDGDDVVNFTSTNGSNAQRIVDIGAGGDDQVSIDNTFFFAGDTDDWLTIEGFDVADDQLRLEINGGADASFQFITAADTDLSVSANGVVVVSSAIGSLTDPFDSVAAEALVAAAVQDTLFVGVGTASFVLYGTGNDAYIYSVDFADATDVIAGFDLDVELVGQVTDIGFNSLGNANFYA